MTDTKKRAHIVSSFTDSGTGESFTAGDTPLIEAGAFANYEAAGLVSAPPAAAKAAAKPKAKPKAAKPARKPPARVSSPAPAPAPAPTPASAPVEPLGGDERT